MGNPIPLERSTGLISEGIHLFKITEGKDQLSTTGNPMWVLTLICQDGGEEDKGKTLTLFLSHSEGARFRVDSFLDAIGAPKKGSMTVEQCVNQLLKVYVQWTEYNGQDTMNAFRFFTKDFAGTVTPPKKSSQESSDAPELSGGGRKPKF